MSAVDRNAPVGPLGITLCVRLHLQIHPAACQSRGVPYTNGVRLAVSKRACVDVC